MTLEAECDRIYYSECHIHGDGGRNLSGDGTEAMIRNPNVANGGENPGKWSVKKSEINTSSLTVT